MLERIAIRFTTLAERWLPDSFVFALVATVIVFVAGLGVGASPGAIADAWGQGFWELLAFTMQMSLVIITGYVVASARPVKRLIVHLAAWPSSSRGAVATVALFSMVSSWFNWGFSLIFSAVLAKEIARRRPRVDYRALGAATLLGLGSVWAQGISGSAALQMATPGAMPERIRAIIAHGDLISAGLVSFAHTIFLWQSFASVAIELVVVTLIMWLATPRDEVAKSAADLGITLDEDHDDLPQPSTPGERIEHSPVTTWLIVALGIAYLARTFLKTGGLCALTLNTINLAFLLLGLALHKTPARLMASVRAATPAVWGVILQFPFYAGIAGMITLTHLNERIATVFVSVSSRATFPALMAAYSALLGVFVPSGGSKWLIEAPYVVAAAHELKVHVGWVVACYDLGEAVANLIQPFWMLPVLALLKLRARDVMGYTFLVFLVLFPLVLLLVTILGSTLTYPL